MIEPNYLPRPGPNTTETDWAHAQERAWKLNRAIIARAITADIDGNPGEVERLRKARADARLGRLRPRPREMDGGENSVGR